MRLVPETWQRTTVGELCSFESGTGFGPVEWTTSGLPIIRIQNLNGSQEFNYFAGNADPAWIVEPGELLFAWAGVKGVSFGPTIWRGTRGVLNQHIYRIRPTSGVELEWLYLQLLHVTASIEANAHGFKSNLVHVRKADITNQVCFRPPLAEQRRIAEIVSIWDRGIRQLSDLIAVKLRFKQGLMQQLLTGKRRFKGFRDEWRNVHLKDVAEINARTLPNNCEPGYEFRYIDLSSVTTGSIELPSSQIRFEDAPSRARRIVRDRDILLATVRPNLKGFAQYRGNGQGVICSTGFAVITATRPSDSDYLWHLTLSDGVSRQFEARIAGSNFPTVNASDVEGLAIPFPSNEQERDRISRVLSLIDNEVETLRRQLTAFKTQKKGLMQRLLTGQVRVKL